MVQGLTAAMVERLTLYEKKNRVLPDRIMIYRDGVSEVMSLPSLTRKDHLLISASGPI